MLVLLFLIFLAAVLIACAFVVWPVLRDRAEKLPARAMLASAIAFLVLGIGGGSYLVLGHPALALRTLQGTNTNDFSALVALLAQRVRTTPNDVAAWVLLGRAYLTVGDADDAAKALARAIDVARQHGNPPPQLLSAYGEALVEDAGGAVTPDAETAFRAALAGNPKDMASRFYLGLADASRGDNTQALALWKSLLADAPANAPWRSMLVDRMASLSAQAGSGPDIGAMVEGLAQRLRAHPDDPEGWQRLIRAYSVMGEDEKARTALAGARAALSAQPEALKAVNDEAAQLNLR